MASRDAAEKTLRDYAGLDEEEAKALVDAVLKAAEEETLELIAGSAPIPTNMGDARALRLRYISQARGQSLSQREIEVLFRLSGSQASNTAARMLATYAQGVDELVKARLATSASVEETGKAGNLRYSVHFDDNATFEYADQLLRRKGMGHDVRRKAHQTLDMPREITDRDGQKRDPLDVLGIPKPEN